MRCSACGCSTPAIAGRPPPTGALETFARGVAFAAGSFVALTALSIAMKWLLIGRFKAQSIPIWSLRYFRFWVVKTMMRTLARGDVHRHADLQRLSAPDGREDRPQRRDRTRAITPICADMIAIGDNTILRKDSIVLGYRAQSNFIHIGPVEIGRNAFVGEASVIDIDTAMGDDTQLGHASSLQSGQRVPDGKRYHGSPAVETTSDYCPIESRNVSALRSGLFVALELAVLLLVAGRAAAPRVAACGTELRRSPPRRASASARRAARCSAPPRLCSSARCCSGSRRSTRSRGCA